MRGTGFEAPVSTPGEPETWPCAGLGTNASAVNTTMARTQHLSDFIFLSIPRPTLRFGERCLENMSYCQTSDHATDAERSLGF